MSIAEKLREAAAKRADCTIDHIALALTDAPASCTESCGECIEKWHGKLADAIEAEQVASIFKPMPLDIEWPRFEDGELVEFGDEIGKGDIWMEHPVDLVAFYDDGSFELWGDGNSIAYRKGEPVKRPEPEVLDADGVPIKVGDTVYGIGPKPFWATVLSTSVTATDEFPLVYCKDNESGKKHNCAPCGLTHRKPDTQEAIDADCVMAAKDYCEKHGIKTEWPKHPARAKWEHLLARQRKLLGGE